MRSEDSEWMVYEVWLLKEIAGRGVGSSSYRIEGKRVFFVFKDGSDLKLLID